jgi:hypothetical protein
MTLYIEPKLYMILYQLYFFHIDQKLNVVTIAGKFEKIFPAMEISKTKNMFIRTKYLFDKVFRLAGFFPFTSTNLCSNVL